MLRRSVELHSDDELRNAFETWARDAVDWRETHYAFQRFVAGRSRDGASGETRTADASVARAHGDVSPSAARERAALTLPRAPDGLHPFRRGARPPGISA